MSQPPPELPPKPAPPDPGECCGGGACRPCVYDAYEQALIEWRQQVERIQAQQGQDTAKAPTEK